MKTLVLLIIGLVTTSITFAQKPEKVYSIVKEMRSEEWYKTQAKLWEAETKKNKKNAEAWYYYYSANRALKNISWQDSTKRNAYFKACTKIVEDAYKAVPNSFEANHLQWWHSFNDKKKISYLEKAYQINPQDPRTYSDLMCEYALEFNEAKVNEFARKLFNVNDMPGSAYNWAYNLLSDAEPNAIILTAGDNDTFLPWIVQQVFNYRKDVTIMNTSLLGLDDYRKRLFEKINIPAFDKSMGNAVSYEQSISRQKELFDHIFKQNENIPIYVSSTALHQFQKHYSDHLYLVGITYKYCEHTVDNLAYIKRNYEKRYQLDYLNQDFSFHPLNKKTNEFNVYYLQAFVKLFWHYTDSEEIQKAEIIKKQIIDIATNGNQKEFLKQWTDELKKQVK
ncbi:MAG: hypothetical protein AB8B72_12215 [Crocinitomicaceae bacterium]